MRRGSIVALLGIGLIAGGVATAVALIPTWLPPDGSREAGRIDFTFWFVIAICIALFAVVAAAMIYSFGGLRRRVDLLDGQVQGGPRRPRGRPVDPRAHRPRDHVDGDPVRPR